MTAEKVAYWYFRLNGFLNIENFVVHPDLRGGQKTEADLFGVRFPYRAEPGMRDDAPFEGARTKPLFIIVEVTRAKCKLNGPWINPKLGNMEYVLGAIGALPADQKDKVAKALYEKCAYPDEGKEREFQLIAVGSDVDPELQKTYPLLIQITLASMLKFVHARFMAYRARKADHGQWDEFGQYLWETAEKFHSDPAAFGKAVEAKI